MSKDFHQEWLELLRLIGSRNMPWGVTGGNEWISYKQIDENDYYVQIFMHGSYDEYKKQREAVIVFFEHQDTVLIEESPIKDMAFGYWRQLTFINKIKIEEKNRKESEKMSQPFTVGSIYAPGGIVNLGTISNSPISIDNSVKEIEKLIEKQGGDEKKELIAFLEETTKMIQEFIDTSKITPQTGFFDRLNAHVVKHGWFYGAILQLLGTAALTIIG